MSSKNNALLLLLVSLAIYLSLILIYNIWFIGDEGYYAVSIYEAIKTGPKVYITFLGVPTFWKPFLMVDTYALMIPLWKDFLEVQTAYRIPSVVFSAINVVLVYFIALEFMDEKKAIIASIAYMLNPIILLFGTKIFMETLAMTFVFIGLLATIRICKKNNEPLFYPLVLLSLLGASLSKSVTIGIMAALLYLLYSFLKNSEKVIGVLLTVALAALIVILIPFLTPFSQAYFQLYVEDFFTRRIGESVWVDNLTEIIQMFSYLIPLFIVSAKKVDLRSKDDLFILLWFIPIILIAVKTPYVWYAFYFVMPAVFLSLKGIMDNVLDLLILSVLILVGVLLIIPTNNYYQNSAMIKTIEYIEKNIDKNECTLYVGAISPMIYSFFEINGYNHNIAITNILMTNGSMIILDANITDKQLYSLVNDYKNSEVLDEITKRDYLFSEWNQLNPRILVKTVNYNCTAFDYVLITDYYKKYDLSQYNYTLVNENEQIRVWKKVRV